MASKYHVKWKQQVTAIVKKLHSHDIVWGDVHPGNIVIDKNIDAWVVDFGSGWIEDFVDRKKAGTNEGDWQGVQNIFEEWINQQEDVDGSHLDTEDQNQWKGDGSLS